MQVSNTNDDLMLAYPKDDAIIYRPIVAWDIKDKGSLFCGDPVPLYFPGGPFAVYDKTSNKWWDKSKEGKGELTLIAHFSTL